MASNKKELDELKKKVALGNRIMFYQGLADYHGHVSARIPGTSQFLIKPVFAPLGRIVAKAYDPRGYRRVHKRPANKIRLKPVTNEK